jgi:hypothetical protein
VRVISFGDAEETSIPGFFETSLEGLMRNTLAALLSLAACTHAYAAENAVTDLLVAAELEGDGYEESQVQDGSTQKSATWSTFATRGTATSAANANGTGKVRVTAAYEYGVGEINSTNSDARLWAGDVLTIRVPGAKPNKQTKLTATVTSTFSIQSTTYGGGNGTSNYCFGSAFCGITVPDWVQARLDLPPASGVVIWAGGNCSGGDAKQFTCKDKRTLVIQGPEAIVPILYELSAAAHSGHNIGWDPFSSVDGSIKWTLKLPDGVSCHSRSGVAFKGLCPRLPA